MIRVPNRFQRMRRTPCFAARLAAVAVALAALAPAPFSAAQPTDVPALSAAQVRQKRASLTVVIDSMARLREELRERQSELEDESGRGRETEILEQIRELSTKLAELERNFSEIAAGVDPNIFDVAAELDVSFSNELRDLLGPLLNELRRMTSRPREIDRLRSEISDLEDHLLLLERARGNIEELAARLEEAQLDEELVRERDDWSEREKNLSTTLAVARQKLEQKQSERISIGETVQGVFQLFFKSRGRNLLLALTATVLFLLVLRRLHLELHRRGPLRRYSPSFQLRLFNLMFAIFTGVGGVLVFLIVLYVFGDWVLLILMVMILMGLVWASKQAIPAFWTQATLLLNMGPVREGERVVYREVPYRVASLGFYTELENPALSQPGLRLPINDLTKLRSRPSSDREPWFPTREEDWILLPDGKLAKVVQQSLDSVKIVLRGGALQVHPTADFLAMAPVVLSDGFRIQVSFGVDYAHVAVVTTDVVAQLRSFVADGLDAESRGEWLRNMQVEFESASASSLDLVVLCDFRGEAAPDYEILTRLVNRLCVDACNANRWVIPFQQVTLHVADRPPDAGSHSGATNPTAT